MSRLLNSWFIVLSPAARALHQRNAPFGKLLLQTLYGALPQENHTFIRKQNPFVYFAVVKAA